MPNSKHIIDKVEMLTVKITLTIDNIIEVGTGVIIKSADKFYIVTVNHTVFGKEGTYQTKKKNLNIKLFNGDILTIDNDSDIENLNTLALIAVDNINIKLPKLLILDKAFYEQVYYLRGYPEAINGGNTSHPFNNVTCDTRDKSSITLNIQNMNDDSSGVDTIDNINGLSGSGVFFKQYNKLFLVGCINELLSSSGVFNGAKANTLIDLNYSKLLDVEFNKFRTIKDVTEKIKEKNKTITEVELEKFKREKNINFSHLNRKHETILHSSEVLERNTIRIKQYLNGGIAIKDISNIDSNFNDKWYDLLKSMLEHIKSNYDTYIESKLIGRTTVNNLVNYISDSIKNEFKYLTDGNSILLDKLTNYTIAKWLLDCNINFIIDEDI